jgi:cell division protein FtsW
VASRAVDVPTRHLRLVDAGERATRAERRAARARERSRARTPSVVVALIAATALLTGIGLVMVLSASSVSSYAQYGSSFLFFKRQAIYVLVGALAMFGTAHIRYRAWMRLWVPVLLVTLGLLVLVLHPSAGTVAGGSARWIAFGPVTVQPSELAKLAMVLFTGAVLVRKWKRLDEPLHLAIPLLLIVGLVCGLILLQPDLGTTVLVAGVVFVMLFTAGVKFRYLLFGLFVSSGLAMAMVMSRPYQKVRLLAFLHPWHDPQNTGYQLIQSLIGLGSGGLFGVGLGASRQKWMYIPNAHTDFIFSILGEELGLIGEFVVLLLFGMLVYMGVRIAVRSSDPYGRLVAAGITGWIGLQTLVNLGTVTGLLPVTGVPLPLVSFGGSSLVVTLAALGILVNIGRATAEPARTGGRTAGGSRKKRKGTASGRAAGKPATGSSRARTASAGGRTSARGARRR